MFLSCFDCFKSKGSRVDDSPGSLVVSMAAVTLKPEMLASTATPKTLSEATQLANSSAPGTTNKMFPFIDKDFNTESYAVSARQLGNNFEVTLTSLKDPGKFISITSTLDLKAAGNMKSMIEKGAFTHVVTGTNMSKSEINACFTEMSKLQNIPRKKRNTMFGW